MQILELMANKYEMKNVMLTVFKQNNVANEFFKKKLKYTVDDISPEQGIYDEEDVSYEILSKYTKIGREWLACEREKETITSKVQEPDGRWPDAIKLIIGDFNHCTLDTQLLHYHQYVTCPTRNERTIDLAYSNVAEAYKCSPLPPLGDSDHNIISLMPKYRPILKTRKPILQQHRVLTPDGIERLQGCLECTDWTVFIDACDDFDELTDTINS
ncbi:N-alpha-acetyltransferase 40 [Elysia marginata]|uniref:N-alpha-acetyltransferase 40 n=1 Tax=Elysia marginata TaxID=1093978 RepID=A0AAV4EIY3_9GAST|nr:N-alpha-acetyltransferase 40 [Elysia marginata]